MRPGLLTLFLCFASPVVFSQNTIGIPAIINYSKQDYHAGSQNWGIQQDTDGVLYFANNDGLLSFDGNFWRIYPLPNHTIVRSLAIDPGHRIYVGGQGEIGYFSPGAGGDLVYTSLHKLIPGQENDFADVWNTIIFQDQVFFRSNRKIFQLDKEKITVYKGVNWDFLGTAGKTLIACEYSQGLVKFIPSPTGGRWTPIIPAAPGSHLTSVSSDPASAGLTSISSLPATPASSRQTAARPSSGSLPTGTQIRSVIPIGKDSFLLTSLAHGLFGWFNNTLTRYETPALKSVSRENINGSCCIDTDKTALITNLGGCVIVNKKGEFVQRFSKKEGLQNNNILSVFLDRNGNIWLGLDNGIDLVTYNNSIRNIFPEPEDRNPGYASIIYQHNLYLGTSTGVYRSSLDTGKDLSFTRNSFQFVRNTTGQIWNLAEVNGKLLMGHNQGAYIIDKDTAIPFDQTSGFWTFQPLSGELMMTGTYNGINFYEYKGGRFTNPNIHAHFESAKFVVIDNNRIWIAHPYKGLYTVEFDKEGKPIASSYPDKNSILSGNHNHLFKIRGLMILTNDKGIYQFDPRQQDFVHSTWLSGLLGPFPVNYLKEDPYGNIWFIRDRKLGVVDRSGASPRTLCFPELNNKVLTGGFENIYIVDSNNVLVAAEKGFFHINYQLYKKDKCPLQTLIRGVWTDNQKTRLIFGGYSVPEPPATADTVTTSAASTLAPVGFPDNRLTSATILPSVPASAPVSANPGSNPGIPMLNYKDNSLHFEFSSPLYGQSQSIMYSYFLKGFDKDWSEWQGRPEKDYTNLHPGKYVFRVKSRNSIDNESTPVSWSFQILPPWYGTWWAYGTYILLFLGLVFGVYRQQEKKFKRRQLKKLSEQQKDYEEEQRKLQYQHQLEIEKNEKEIIRLKNERLNTEVAHKNSELASAAMILVQKGKLLSKIKEDLVRLKNNAEIEKESKDYKKIIRIIEGELGNSHEWEQFAAHFDDVHTNYLKTLKKRYPDLTTSDLKLCAYLRLNLSSKEIAQLMNISIRGVETGRYRVRKKLEIPNDVSLFDFLLTITS